MAATELSIKREDLPGSQVGLTIEIPSDDVDAAFERTLARLSQRVKVQGFRPGKAPRALVEARVGAEALREEVIEELVPKIVGQAIADEKIDSIDRPRVDVLELDRGKPGKFLATVSVMPVVTLADLGALKVEKKTTEVTNEMVERRLTELLNELGEIEPVDREVRDGDIVVADLEVSAEGERVTSADRKAIELEVVDGELIPEVRAALPGHKVGDEVAVEVTMAEDHRDPELAGKLATLKFTIHGVKERTRPALTDEVAKQLSGGEQESVLAFRGAVRADLEERARKTDDLAYEQAVVKEVVEGSSVDVPAFLVDREVERLQHDLEHRLADQGLKLDRFFAYTGSSLGDWQMKARPDAEARLRVDIILEEITRREGIEPSEEEVAEHLRVEAASDAELAGQIDQLLKSSTALDYFRHRLTRLRTVGRLADLASGAARPR